MATKSTIMAHIPFLLTQLRSWLSTTDQDVAEDMQRHVKSYLGSNSSLETLEKGNIPCDSKMADLPRVIELSLVSPLDFQPICIISGETVYLTLV